MTCCRLARTLAMAPPKLPVVSTSSTTSGFGGIGGVDTTLATGITVPGSAAWATTAGLTPGAAHAGVASAVTAAVTPANTMTVRDRRQGTAAVAMVAPSAPPRVARATSAATLGPARGP